MVMRGWVILLGVLSLLAQVLAFHGLVEPGPGEMPLLVFLLEQALAAALTTACYAMVWPSFYAMPARAPLLHVFLTCWFLPLAGAAIFLAEMLVQRFVPLPLDRSHLGRVDTPEFNHHLLPHIAHGVGARLLAKLTTADAPLSSRLSAVISLRSMPLRHTSGRLTELLGDGSDEIRLLAYGAIDGAEKDIMKQIFEIESVLKGDDAQESTVMTKWMRLAELYWELIYQNLVMGEVHQYVLAQVVDYAQRVVQRDGNRTEMYYLLARCALIRREIAAAEQYLGFAQTGGFPKDRLIPWQAEVAFHRGDYRSIPSLLKKLGDGARLPQLQPIQRYWSR